MSDRTKKQEILEAAAQLFRDKGYAATSMRDLARAVNLKASSLYNHIGSKEEILQLICFENARRFLEAMEQVEQGSGSALQKVETLIRFHITEAMEDVTSVTSFNDEWRHLSESQLVKFKALRKDYENRFKKLLEEGIAKGELRSTDSTIALFTILSSVRWLYDWYRSGGRKTPEQISQNITNILLKGLKA